MAVVDTLLPKAYIYTTSWQDISADIMSFQVRWGRTTAWENPRARTVQIKLLNLSRRYEPGYVQIYYDYIRQGTKLHVDLYAASGASNATYAIFNGTISQVRLHYPEHTDHGAYAVIEAADPLAILAKETSYSTIASDHADDMVNDVLAELVWTGGLIDASTMAAGTVTLQSYNIDGGSLLSAIERIAWSDERMFYLAPNATDKDCNAYLPKVYGITFPGTPDSTLITSDIYDIVLGVSDDQCYSHCRLTGQNNDIGAFTYDETGGHIEDMWYKVAHGLADLQEVWFSAVGGGAAGYAVDTHYWVIYHDADRIQLASSLANAVADTPIAGTGDSTGTWTMRVCGTLQTASRTADAQAMGERVLVEDGLLLWTDAEVDARATDEMTRRHALIGILRPIAMTVRIAAGVDVWGSTSLVSKAVLLAPMASVSLNFDPGTGTSRIYELYTLGGVITWNGPKQPLIIQSFTEHSDLFE